MVICIYCFYCTAEKEPDKKERRGGRKTAGESLIYTLSVCHFWNLAFLKFFPRFYEDFRGLPNYIPWALDQEVVPARLPLPGTWVPKFLEATKHRRMVDKLQSIRGRQASLLLLRGIVGPLNTQLNLPLILFNSVPWFYLDISGLFNMLISADLKLITYTHISYSLILIYSIRYISINT